LPCGFTCTSPEAYNRSRRAKVMYLQARVRLGAWSLLTVLIFGCGGSDEGAPTSTDAPTTRPEHREGAILLQDDFSGSCRWEHIVREEGEGVCADGAYRIFVEQARRQLWSNLGSEQGRNEARLGLDGACAQVGARTSPTLTGYP
jgi:hypothetical protein